jgi:hypothetical protein
LGVISGTISQLTSQRDIILQLPTSLIQILDICSSCGLSILVGNAPTQGSASRTKLQHAIWAIHYGYRKRTGVHVISIKNTVTSILRMYEIPLCQLDI